jgi:hypothetical protein
MTLVALAGCRDLDRGEPWDQDARVRGVTALEGGFMLVADPFGTVLSLGEGLSEPQGVPVGGRVLAAVATADGGAVVLTDAPSLARIGPDAGIEAEWELAAGFDALTVTPDGRFAFVSFTPGYTPDDGALLFNPQLVAWVDLSNPGSAPSTLRLNGPRPIAVVAPKPVSIDDDPDTEHLVAVLGDSTVAFVVLDTAPGLDPQRLVRLTDPTLAGSVVATSVELVDPDPLVPDDVRAFVVVRGLSDVVSVSLLTNPAGGAPLASVNLLGVGSPPTAAYSVGDSEPLLVLTGSDRAWSVDGVSGVASPFDVQVPAAQAVLWTLPGEGPSAFFWSPGSDRVAFGPVTPLLEGGLGLLTARRLSAGVEQVTVDAAGRYAVARLGGSSGVSIIDLATGREATLPSSGTVAEVEIGGDLAFVTVAGRSAAALVNLLDGSFDEVPLPAPVSAIYRSVDGATLLLDHDEAGGHLSRFAWSQGAAGPARAWRGFLWGGILNRDAEARP